MFEPRVGEVAILDSTFRQGNRSVLLGQKELEFERILEYSHQQSEGSKKYWIDWISYCSE